MKYVVLIHSNPQPWGHPTIDYTQVGRAVPDQERAAMAKEFEAMLGELSESGELVTGLALDAPATARTYRFEGKRPVSTDGPYAESKEQLAGFFVLDCATRERAEELAAKFAGPGDVIELRPEMEF
ncbi:YciI family protein [Kribbella solani]|uniref:YciI family protein n=1 Tax=Kribbella solani TaxID=236067 RepID=UPI0029B360EE|nr:YciI family protein [Kribbella solani]MDX2969279.1 YciI family protein [Kribbella solani]MDX3004274.1 YciI family protein [Kribbella solani]